MRIHAIIQARLKSERLPCKVLLPIGNHSLLEIIIRGLQQSRTINKIIVATSTSIFDDLTENLCNNLNIEVFRGDHENVLERYYQCAKVFNSDIIIRITADDPFNDIKGIDRAVEYLVNNNMEYVSNNIIPSYPEGLDFEIFTYHTLEKIFNEVTSRVDKEHVTSYLKDNVSDFKTYNFIAPVNYSDIKLSIDRIEDYLVIDKLISNVKKKPYLLNYSEIVRIIGNNKELFKLNSIYPRNEGYIRSKEKNDETN